jgi:hypothetical protein
LERDRRANEDHGQGVGKTPYRDDAEHDIGGEPEAGCDEDPAVKEENAGFDEGEGENVDELEGEGELEVDLLDHTRTW